ncbi:E3 ubiquitin-protein ligase UPL7 [Argentina anserina]|uniref:E3 ubiquitin-protein ligase UPL7 n=1 Tax=Argentina anserina TaxID=57926 RepID=UPI00217682A3|nr:E3 ubiquitin-protein ligase UPL7 [Potentilla anserina]XP_050380358.1 E3 ubiquitin-protein ligase UPL7 [Potentilla anserina]
MDDPRKHQVSLRGASAKEITRDALLEKVSQERELRQYARRATAAALFLQRVWRRYRETRTAALEMREEWEKCLKQQQQAGSVITAIWISSHVVRPFLFFVSCLLIRKRRIEAAEVNCMKSCFQMLLDSLNSTDSKKNYCSLAIGTVEERRVWGYQSRRLISLCIFVLSECDKSRPGGQDIVAITSLAMQLVVVLTDVKGWKSVDQQDCQIADTAVKDLVRFLGSGDSGLYSSIRTYINTLDVPCALSRSKSRVQTDDSFLITASTITLALRPFHVLKFDVNSLGLLDVHDVAEKYSVFLLTIPWLTQRLPAVLIPAMRHKSILQPCFQTLLILKEKILKAILAVDQSMFHVSQKVIPPVGWALANVICLATGGDNDSVDPGGFHQEFNCASYVRASNILAENLLVRLEIVDSVQKNQDAENNIENSEKLSSTVSCESEVTNESIKLSFLDMFRPISQQWHLTDLLAIVNKMGHSQGSETNTPKRLEFSGNLELLDIMRLYSFMLRMFSSLNPRVGSLPVLNMLSFTPGFLVSLWEVLETYLFPRNVCSGHKLYDIISKTSGSGKDWNVGKRKKHGNNDGGNKWVSALHKITGKSQAETGDRDLRANQAKAILVDKEDSSDVWDIELMRPGPQGISKDTSCMLYLFCASYSHLLLILDDIEFYEKQVPFTLEQQRQIASVLNTLVYNGLSQSIGQKDRPLMESAVRCLHLIYERDCRHQFCPPVLWLSPARKNRPPIAIAARTHEILSTNQRSDDSLALQSIGSVITTTPHVFPFEERVEMFREFIKMDKAARKMAGEVAGTSSRSVEIVVRRGHIVEDGYQQLNSLGSRLKSSIHVSFVSECGLPEAGLDYGGLSKEFLTDISKAAFAPDYGLFSQTSTSDRLLIPNPSAKYLDNGIQMIEFLGRVVGKALYEGILLDYSFSHVFVHKLLGRYSFLDELSTLDPEIYRNLMYVKHYEGDVEELCLDFTVTEESFGNRHVIELKPGGKDVTVTSKNKMQYIHAIADYKLNRQMFLFSNAFYRGLVDLISPSWLKLFNAGEFNQLLSGGVHDIDVDDLRKNTRYTGGYSEGNRTIKIFWEVISRFEPNERCMLLKFVTSCSRAPLLGFKHLQPTFTIHKVACDIPLWATMRGHDIERLPSASTCYNTLKLPTYKRPSTLREKLLYAISSNAGFELS